MLMDALSFELYINNELELEKFAYIFAKKVEIGDVVLLQGNLGCGKTAFARYLINSISSLEQYVTSPTFNILQTYETVKGPLWHFDLYRINSINEAYELGIEDCISCAINIIEWPELVIDFFGNKSNICLINFDFGVQETHRIIRITSYNKKFFDFV